MPRNTCFSPLVSGHWSCREPSPYGAQARPSHESSRSTTLSTPVARAWDRGGHRRHSRPQSAPDLLAGAALPRVARCTGGPRGGGGAGAGSAKGVSGRGVGAVRAGGAGSVGVRVARASAPATPGRGKHSPKLAARASKWSRRRPPPRVRARQGSLPPPRLSLRAWDREPTTRL